MHLGKLFLALGILSQTGLGFGQERAKLEAGLRAVKNDQEKSRQLNQLGRFYLFKPGEEKNDLDSALFYFYQARAIAERTGDSELQYKVIKNIGNAFVEKGELEKGIGLVRQAVKYYHQNGDLRSEADTWLLLGNLYRNNLKDDHVMESMASYNQALPLMKQLGRVNDYLEIKITQGDILLGKGKLQEGERKFLEVVSYLNQTGAKGATDGDVWFSLGVNLGFLPGDYYDYCSRCFGESYRLFIKDKKFDAALLSLEYASNSLMEKQHYTEVEKTLKEALALGKKIKSKNLYRIYSTYATLCDKQHRYTQALEFYTKAVETLPDFEKDKAWYYNELSRFYFNWKIADKGIYWLKEALSSAEKYKDKENYGIYLARLAAVLVKQHQGQQAIALLSKHKESGLGGFTRLFIIQSYAMAYISLGEYAKAGPFIEKIPPLVLEVYASKPPNAKYKAINGFYTVLVDYYLKTKDFSLAEQYLKKIEATPKAVTLVANPLEYLFRFKIDSAKGDFAQAIKAYSRYKSESDALNTLEKARQVNELIIKYDVSKKDKSIAELNHARLLQQQKIQRAATQRNVVLIGIVSLLILAAVLWWAFYKTKKGNQLLKISQAQINSQNNLLQGILGDKEELLKEKDWLIREVHHRVKNNLQIVMSLLHAQSFYIGHEAAVEAIRDSQNRVQSISLIHQKLYTGANLSRVNVKGYVKELIAYLADSFDTDRRGIVFETLIDELFMEVSQAVPLGLILNEGITNAVKYAYGDQGGRIVIGLQELQDGTVLLSVTDQGKGLAKGFDFKRADSLGMKMIRALSKQLGGEAFWSSKGGTRLAVEFKLEENCR